MRATWLADALRAAGLEVVELRGWQRRGGEFNDLRACVWHHDGSAIGDSPGVPGYMAGQIDSRRAGAQLWVNRYGVWHVIAAGSVFHAGRVLRGKPGNSNSLGIETDATTNEPWPGTLLASLREGTAALLARIGYAPSPGLEFHSTVCSPVGRKNDPDGLDLAQERRAVAALMTPAAPEGDDMARTCIPTTAKRAKNGRFPFFRLTEDNALVLAYNGAKLKRTDGNVYGVPFMRLGALNSPPVGLCEAPGGPVVVVCGDGGTIDVAA